MGIFDSIIGLWYVFGTWMMGILFPDLKKEVETYKTLVSTLRKEIRDSIFNHQQDIEDIVEARKASEKILLEEYADLERRFGDVVLELEELKKSKQKKKAEVGKKPIKPRSNRSK